MASELTAAETDIFNDLKRDGRFVGTTTKDQSFESPRIGRRTPPTTFVRRPMRFDWPSVKGTTQLE
jgi:hypothetical protein